jgi:hypothetical protein
LWPFLVNLVLVLPLIVIIYIVMGIGFMLLAVVAQAAGKDAAGVIIGLGSIVFVMLEFVMILLVTLAIQPFMLRAGLSQDFGQAFKFGWAMDYLKRNWLEIILFQLFFMVTGVPLMLAGALVFCIGAYAAGALLILAQAHMLLQLYNLHLARGGEPIPLKEPIPPMLAAGT